VILLRMEKLPVGLRLARLHGVWAVVEANLPGKFLAVTKSKLRVRSLSHS
jgi:hypothetical protein